MSEKECDVCLEHSGLQEQLENLKIDIKGDVNRSLKVMTAILTIGVSIMIALTGWFVRTASGTAAQLVIIDERQQQVMKWKESTEWRLDSYERVLITNGKEASKEHKVIH